MNSIVMSFDFGMKRIGVAVGQKVTQTASGLGVVQAFDGIPKWDYLDKIVLDWQPERFIVGLPINMDGTEGPRVQATRDWSLDLVRILGIPVAFWDERLSTVAVERMMLKADMTRNKRAAKIDQAAAAYILQGALDNIGMQNS